MIENAQLRRTSETAETPRWPPPRRAAAAPDQHLIGLVSPSSFDSEPYRILQSILEARRATQPSLVIAVTSAAPGDGKTTTSINLAAMLARLPDSRVLLLDADLRRPAVLKRLGLGGQAGPDLAQALRHPELVATGGLATWPDLPLSVLASSGPDALPSESLHSPAFGGLIQRARQAYRYVIADTAPVVALPDARALAGLVDGFLLVVRAGATPRNLLAEALEALEPDRVLGLIFNGDERPYAGYYGRYRSYYQAAKQAQRG